MGSIDTRAHGELALALPLRLDDGAVRGSVHSRHLAFDVASAVVTSDSVMLRLEGQGGLVAVIEGEWNRAGIRGTWAFGDDSGSVSLDRIGQVPEFRELRLNLAPVSWREDLRYLATELPLAHGNAFRHLPARVFADSVSALEARLDTMSAPEIHAAMARLVTLLRDPDTSMLPLGNSPRYPIWLKAFGDTLRITQVVAGYEGLLGRRVVAVGESTVQEASRRSWRWQGVTGNQYARRLDPSSLVLAQLVHDAGIVPHADRARFTLQSRSGLTSPIMLPALDPTAHVTWVSAQRATPLYQQEPYSWYRYMPESRTLYLRISPHDGPSDLRSTVEAMLRFEELVRPDRLVLDLRTEIGSAPWIRDILLARLAGHPMNRAGRLFAAIDEHVGFGEVATAIALRDLTHATLVGQDAPLSPARQYMRRWLELPNSRFHIDLTVRPSPYLEDEDATLEPDVRIPLTWEDYEAGRDPVLEWIIRQPVAW